MRRFVKVILISPLLGALMNVGVTWYLATTPSVDKFARPTEYVHFQYADMSLLDGMRYDKRGTMYVAISYLNQRYTPTGWADDVPAFVARQPAFVQRRLIAWCGDLERPSPKSRYIAIIARGWPMVALYSIEEISPDRSGQGVRGEYRDRGAIVIPLQTDRNSGYSPVRAIALPWIPIWRGFVVNTLLYGALALLPWCIGPLRRWIRFRRGKCPCCGYDLRGKLDDGCSECGWKRAANAMPST